MVSKEKARVFTIFDTTSSANTFTPPIRISGDFTVGIFPSSDWEGTIVTEVVPEPVPDNPDYDYTGMWKNSDGDEFINEGGIYTNRISHDMLIRLGVRTVPVAGNAEVYIWNTINEE